MVLMKKTADKPAADAVLLQLAQSDRLPAQAKSMVAAFVGIMGKDIADCSLRQGARSLRGTYKGEF